MFNPINQGETFDPWGGYVRKWCPELAKMPAEWLHRPWQAPGETLALAGVELGRDYPEPLVNNAIARELALEAFARIQSAAP